MLRSHMCHRGSLSLKDGTDSHQSHCHKQLCPVGDKGRSSRGRRKGRREEREAGLQNRSQKLICTHLLHNIV